MLTGMRQKTKKVPTVSTVLVQSGRRSSEPEHRVSTLQLNMSLATPTVLRGDDLKDVSDKDIDTQVH
jgi:hypothetical protein